MKSWVSKLYNIWELTRNSLFYVPVIISFCFIAGIIAVFLFELHYTELVHKIHYLYAGSIEDAKSILQTALSAMITMTTLVISITMVVLSLSASQLGPRLINTFMSSRVTQIYIGFFFGSIALCLTLLILLHDNSTFDKTPRLSISASFTITFINLFILLGYVNHVARSGIADTTINRVSCEIQQSLERLCTTDDLNDNKANQALKPADFESNGRALYSSHNGYIQNIQYPTLLTLAQDTGLVIQLDCMAGDYLFKGQQVGIVYPANKITPEIELALFACIDVGENRTGAQDIEYSVRHLVEIAIRALSPGINDDFTAITVLDKLSGLLAQLMDSKLPSHIYHDESGQLKLVAKSSHKPEIFFRALSKIRDAGKQNPGILMQLIFVLGELKNSSYPNKEYDAINLQIAYIRQHITEFFAESEEQKALEKMLSKYGLKS
ncbi:DUF2254 domain-containing protein [Kangiella japonica]|uniref:DUF2254 domain-containing protein n=1 Tax=Kangiella japonica TaxID=647384 RepID=A0ABN0SX94_9GAMM